jgi:hypothetical protein
MGWYTRNCEPRALPSLATTDRRLFSLAGTSGAALTKVVWPRRAID